MEDTTRIFGALIFSLLLHYLKERKKENPIKILTARELQNSFALSISGELGDKIRDRFGDLKLINLYVLKIKIENSGSPVKYTDLIEPIELSFDNEFLECICIEKAKGINITLDNGINYKKEYCRFDLMNTGDWFTLQFVSLQKLSTPIVNSRIAGSPKVNIISGSSLGKILSSPKDRSLSFDRSRAFAKVSTNKQKIKEIVILITAVVALVYFYLLR
jgi:hypothetical protein